MSNFDRVKRVERGPFHTRQQALTAWQQFKSKGGVTFVEGGLRLSDSRWGWAADVRADDNHKSHGGNFGCGRCARTGQFITRVENGKPRGPGGICFRCEGKGYHTREDRKRNEAHDRLSFARGY